MTVEVSFPDIEKKPAPVRSLANFIMENSSLYLEKEVIDEQETLSGNIVNDVTTSAKHILYIKYTDPNSSLFPQSERIGMPTLATYEGGNVKATASAPGANGNKYKFKLYENSEQYFVVEVYEQVGEDQYELIGSGTTTTTTVFATYNMYKANNINNITLSNGNSINNYVVFNGRDLNYTTTSLPIEFQLSGGADDDGKDYDIIADDSEVIHCNTVLCKANTKIELASYNYVGSTGYLSKVENFVNIPVTIIPKVDGSINTDSSVLPVFEDESNLIKIDLPLSNKADYDTQLRTTSFTIVAFNNSTEQETLRKDVYYKIGVCPLDGTENTRDAIIRELSYHCIITDGTGKFNLNSPIWQTTAYALTESELGYIFAINHDYDGRPALVPISMCTALYSNGDIVGLIYFRLYNEDGSLFTDEILEDEYAEIFVKEDSDSEAQSCDDIDVIYLPLRNYKLNGGFIKTPIVEYSSGGGGVTPVTPKDGK